jgi:hypothetical protein
MLAWQQGRMKVHPAEGGAVLITTEARCHAQLRCATHPAEARAGARDGTGLLIPLAAASTVPNLTGFERKLTVGSGDVELAAHLMIPGTAAGAVVIADGGESGRRHPWARFAAALNQAGLGTLVVGLLTKQEMLSYGNRFNVRALAGRLTGVTRWMLRHPAAALWAAAAEPRVPVAAIACQDGRPDLAWPRLGLVRSPTLLIVDGHDEVILGLNRRARQQLSSESDLAVIAGYARLPGEPGAREQVAGLAAGWFTRHFMAATGGYLSHSMRVNDSRRAGKCSPERSVATVSGPGSRSLVGDLGPYVARVVRAYRGSRA